MIFISKLERLNTQFDLNKAFYKRIYRGKNGERNCGELTIVAEEAEDQSREAVVFALRALKLDKKQFFGKSDPFLQIYRINDDGSFVLFSSLCRTLQTNICSNISN